MEVARHCELSDLIALSATCKAFATLPGVTKLGAWDQPLLTNAMVARLPGLTHLEVAHCTPTDVGISRLLRLSHLGLDESSITDAGLFSLTGLTHLFLWPDNTLITEAGLAAVSHRLTHLTLRQHTIMLTDATIGRFTRLQHLCISLECKIEFGVLDAELAALTQLKSLHLEGCPLITDAGLSRLTALTSLTIRNENITDAGLLPLAGSLARLDITSNKHVSGAGLLPLRKLTHLATRLPEQQLLPLASRLTHLHLFNYVVPKDPVLRCLLEWEPMVFHSNIFG